MPNVFQSQVEFREWFNDPMNGMLDRNQSLRDSELVGRLHTVMRPFFLRRLKRDVETQLPKKVEHVIKCRMSLRQRRLYEDFMSNMKTKETLERGSYLGMMNVLMQLRKVRARFHRASPCL